MMSVFSYKFQYFCTNFNIFFYKNKIISNIFSNFFSNPIKKKNSQNFLSKFLKFFYFSNITKLSVGEKTFYRKGKLMETVAHSTGHFVTLIRKIEGQKSYVTDICFLFWSAGRHLCNIRCLNISANSPPTTLVMWIACCPHFLHCP